MKIEHEGNSVKFVVSESEKCGVWGLTAGSTQCVLPSKAGSSLRFQIEGSADVVTGLSLLTDDDAIIGLQTRCSELRALYKVLAKDISVNQWGKNLKRYRRSHEQLKVF